MKTPAGFRERALERLGNPLEWNDVSMILVILAVLVPIAIGGVLRTIDIGQHSEIEPYVSRSVLDDMVRVVAGYVLFALILIGVGLWPRRTQRPTRAYAHVVNRS